MCKRNKGWIFGLDGTVTRAMTEKFKVKADSWRIFLIEKADGLEKGKLLDKNLKDPSPILKVMSDILSIRDIFY